MQLSEYTLVLTGGDNTRTCVLNRIQFVNGKARVSLYPNELDTFLRYMGRSYKAYLAGSQELADAQERDRQNGIQRNLQADSEKPDGSPDSVQSSENSSAGSISGEGTLHDSGIEQDSAGRERLVSGGPRHEDTGLGEGVEPDAERESGVKLRVVRQVVGQIPWDRDEGWTSEGLPSVEYVCEAAEDQSITREIIDFACPGYTRTAAEDAQAL